MDFKAKMLRGKQQVAEKFIQIIPFISDQNSLLCWSAFTYGKTLEKIRIIKTDSQ